MTAHSEGRFWSQEGTGKTKAKPDHSPPPFECALGGVGILIHPLWKRICLGNRKCPLAETVFPLVSANTQRHPCTLMHTNYTLAGACQEAAGGSSCL